MPTTYLRTLLARSHAATLRTQLLLSRCRLDYLPLESTIDAHIDAHTDNPPHKPIENLTQAQTQADTPPLAARTAWYTQQQQNFLAWLDQGGLTQEPVTVTVTVGTIGNSGIAPLSPAPLTGADEESQFSQVRVQDAVR